MWPWAPDVCHMPFSMRQMVRSGASANRSSEAIARGRAKLFRWVDADRRRGPDAGNLNPHRIVPGPVVVDASRDIADESALRHPDRPGLVAARFRADPHRAAEHHDDTVDRVIVRAAPGIGRPSLVLEVEAGLARVAIQDERFLRHVLDRLNLPDRRIDDGGSRSGGGGRARLSRLAERRPYPHDI